MLTNVIHRWHDIQKLKSGQKINPHFADLHTSDACNHKCNGCAYKGKHSGNLMPIDKHFFAVDTMIDHGVMAFDFAGGGEPTLLPYLPELMQHIARRGRYFGLITNGLRLTYDYKLIEVILKHATYLRVSFEASTPWNFARYKGVSPIQFTRIMDAVSSIVEERNRNKYDLEISLKFSVGKSLRGPQHYNFMFSLAEGLQVDRIAVKPLRHEPEELNVHERLAEYAFFQKAVPAQHSYRIVDSLIPRSVERVPQCWLNPLHVVMDQNGDLYLCCYYYYRDNDFKIGNIFETPFEDIWLSDLHRQKIANIKKSSCSMVDCKFFAHHDAVASCGQRGQIYYL